MRSLIIDTDGGTDDAVALWWALTDPRVDLAAVLVTWGNVDRETAAANVCRILNAAGRYDVPVALGAAEAIGPTPLSGFARHVHGEDGLGGTADRWPVGRVAPVSEPAEKLLARLTEEHPGQLDLVTIGPLSTVANALATDAGIPARVRSLTVMGGVVLDCGNVLPFREANIANDPSSAAAVVAAGWPAPPLLVGLDVTMKALLHDEDIAAAVESGAPVGRFIADPLRAYAGFCAREGQTPAGTLPCHDLLAVVAVVEPEIIRDAPTVPLAVDTGESAAWGATIADLRQSGTLAATRLPDGFTPWRVALHVDARRFRSIFHDLVSV